MSTELSNGVIIPEEYSDDWYDEMSINLRKLNDVITAASDNATNIQRLDTDKANQSDLTALTSRVSQNETDIIALQTAVSGALKREIVQSLPTEDISTTTIYMIRNSQSSGTNIYDEYMYINSQWELIGTSATDFSNYYTKNETDNLLSAKANQTDLTSLSGRVTQNETDITALQTAVSGALKREIVQSLPTQDISTTTIYMIRNTTTSGDNIYDEYMYINSHWELIGTSATDFSNYYTKTEIDTLLSGKADDNSVVHLSGSETISGFKNFENIILTNSIKAISLDNETADINDCYSSFAQPNSPKNGNVALYSCNTDVSTANITNLPEQKAFYLISITIRYLSNTPTVKQILFTRENIKYERFCNVGTWSNWIKDTDKFVTTDTNQTISGNKTFSSNVNVYNSDSNATTPNLYLRSSKIEISSQGNTSGDQNLTYLDKNNTLYANVKGAVQSNGSAVKIRATAKDSSNNSVINELQMLAYTNGTKAIFPSYSNEIDLGTSSYKWKSFNGVEPSSLSLPSGSIADQVDISSYFTNTGSGDTNSYTALANGWVYLYVTACSTLTAFVQTANNTLYADYKERSSDGQIRIMLPIQKNIKFTSLWTTSTNVSITKAVFIPCKGNI